MIEVRSYTASDAEAWDAYVRGAPGSHFGQRVAWMQLMEHRTSCRPRYRIALRDGRVCGVLPAFESRSLLGGGRLFSAPGGLLADDGEAAGALIREAADHVRRHRLDYLELRDQRRRWDGLETVEENATLELELERDEESQWRRFDAKLRNRIRKGLQSGFEVRFGASLVRDFHRVMLENMRDLGTPIRSAAYYGEALEQLGPAATLLVLRNPKEPVSAMFLVEHGDTLANPWASSLRRYSDQCPNQVLYWEAIKNAIARGLRRFDFGRSQWNSPTFLFKEQWRAKPVPLYYQYVLGRAQRPPTVGDQKQGFALASAVWRTLPLAVVRTAGEPLRRRFPEAL